MSAKKNLTIRIDSQLRDKLEFIAGRELRTLANQIMVFLNAGVNTYLEVEASEEVRENYLHYLAEKYGKSGDIPF